MIRQEKRKRRWLMKNGFTIVTEDNQHVLESLGFLYKKPWLVGEHNIPIYAHKEIRIFDTYIAGFRDSIFVVTQGTMESKQLHEIKLEYLQCITDPNERKKIRRAVSHWWSDIKHQWAALIKHGVNPWW
ncbi:MULTISPECIES: hypothetical protein [Paenibacillus]|uniref:Uncharacterized protein n=1 Tax=Paenibacillus pabuli TaxID=1472 RepID=A0A855XR71_9BACL|nr:MULTISPECIES: hypothetical protein [Paenibacillus]PWW37386.1 hypothetical protein DET56_109273 [Paenibacillus pabuli]PXW05528.1 hypothetical protein DEU73_108272 [Paenibacillus taichungensis]